MADTEIQEEITRFREKLLELSNRNPLLAYRKTRLKTISIIDELPDQIYQRLVAEGKRFRFAARPEEADATEPESTHADQDSRPEWTQSDSLQLAPAPDPDSEPAERHTDGVLQTDLSEARLETVLKGIRRDASGGIQETGVNYLYLALGMLAWYEAESSDREHKSPLLLIPIEIERYYDNRSKQYQYAAKWREEEIQDNLCLVKRLEKDFGIRVPRYDEDQTPEVYFEQVRSAVSSNPRWRVDREALIGFFSFQKLLMYLDIDPANWSDNGAMGSESILHQVVWGREESEGNPLYASDYDIDEHPDAGKIVFPLDADSSQHSALVDIQKGKSLVIEGPPGTGKSQTITNAIAAAIHQGKSVLFVAEKLTALTVVHEKLAKLGLDDFCLELHSDGASPRRVFESLGRRLEGRFDHPGKLEEVRNELQRKQEQLSEYLQETSRVVGPYSEPVYDLLWRVTNLRSQGLSTLRDSHFDRDCTKAELEDRVDLLDAFAESLAELTDPKQSPWWGCWLTEFNPTDPRGVVAAVEALQEIASETDTVSADLVELLGEEGVGWLVSRLGDPTIVATAELLASTSSAFQEDYDLRPLYVKNRRKKARALAKLSADLGTGLDAIALVTSLPVTEAAKSTQSLRRLLDEPFLATVEQENVQELRAAPAVVGPLLNMLREFEIPSRGDSDHAAIHHQMNQLFGGRCLQEMVQLHSLASSKKEAIQECDAQVGDGIADWFGSVSNHAEVIDRIDQLAKACLALNPLDDLRTLLDPSVRQLAVALGEKLVRFRSLKNFVGGRVFASVEEARPKAQGTIEVIDERLSTISKLTWSQAKQLRSRLSTLLAVLKDYDRIAEELRDQGLGPNRTLRELHRSVYLCKLARHAAVADIDGVSSQLFYRATSDLLRSGIERASALEASGAILGSRFDLASLPEPEELRELLQSLRIHSTSLFRIFSKEYRSTKRRIAAFTRGTLPKTVSALIPDLEGLTDWLRDKDSFAADEALQQTFGGLFAGVDTEWDRCKLLRKWVSTAESSGLDHIAVSELLSKRDERKLPMRRLIDAVKALESEFAGDHGGLTVLGYSGDVTDVPIATVGERAVYLRDALDTLEASAAVFAWDSDESLADAKGFCEQVLSLEGLEKEIGDSTAWAPLEGWYASLETDVDQLSTCCDWATKLAGLELPSRATSFIFSRDPASQLADLCSAMARLAPTLESWDACSDRLPAVRCWLELVGEALEIVAGQSWGLKVESQDRLTLVAQHCNEISRVARLQESVERSADWIEDLGGLYRGAESQPEELTQAAEWASQVNSLDMPQEVADRLAEGGASSASDRLLNLIQRAISAKQAWNRQRSQIGTQGELDKDWLAWRLPEGGSPSLRSEVDPMAAEIDQLPAWAAFCRLMLRCQTNGIGDFTAAVLDGVVEPNQAGRVYQYTVLAAVAEASVGGSKTLKSFSRNAIEKSRSKYQQLDKELLRVNRSLVAHQASQGDAPQGVSTGRVGDYTELGLIRHEIQKQRRHCRIRDLLTRAGSSVQSLKPVFMMSPLSVSQYLAPEGVQFDLVVMDEASQVKPEDAIGVLLRAKQIVVVGDPKQLPPSSFFDKIGGEVEDEEATQFDNTESVLEVAMKAFQPVRRLRWHYRSQHESLIQFSNDRFYDGDLVVFPSPSAKGGLLGVKHHLVPDATFLKGINRVEAEYVARAIIEHAKARPQETLAVGAFNKAQSTLISELLQKFCAGDDEARLAVDLLGAEEEILIKNLDNLQGDERDVVFISYTYGPDPADGEVKKRFGPITGDAGWRRLNVLISRARMRVEVFSSMPSSGIKPNPNASRGVIAYRDYLAFAAEGVVPERVVLSDRPMDSPFEEAVARVVANLGMEVVPQVGVAGYFIDLGVRLPGEHDFLLGIECDGATYHSSKSARDRDRLREEVIRSRGWDLYRIWSTDWYLNQKHEEERLATKLRQVTAELNGTA